jgi:serine/threonine-protein kinase
MIDPRMSRFWRLALQSGLIDDHGLSECWESIPADRRPAADQIDRRLARQAIQAKLITLWQAQQLLAGRVHGFKVGRYVLMDLIGQGGMGRVYLAKDTRLGRTVALKILSADRMKNPRAIARFQREAKVGAQLQHENLVRIYDFGESDGRHFLVMEYIEGKTIGAMIAQQGSIPPAVVAGLGRQIALGLDHAHKKGLIHRDVNPYNIMVTYDGTAKLADLGLALDLADNDRFTRDGATVGTFDYVAPEQARHSHSADIRSDIYSLGCTLYHMIAGEVPFPTSSLPEKLYAHQSVDAVPLDQVVPGIPKALADGIGRMMRKSPDERYSTPMQVAHMLEPFIESASRPDFQELTGHLRTDIRPGPEAKTLLIPQGGFESGSVASSSTSGMAPAGSRSIAQPSAPVRDSSVTIPGPLPRDPSGTAMPSASNSASDLDLPLMVDLGPEPSLSEVLAESRKLPRSWNSGGSVSGVWSPRDTMAGLWRDFLARFPRLGPMGIGLMILAVSAGAVAIAWMMKPVPGVNKLHPASPANAVGSGEKTHNLVTSSSGDPVPATATNPSSAEMMGAPIVVRPYGGNGRDIPAKDLSDAILKALGSRGMVVLRDRKPLELSNASLIQVNLRGSVQIRAENGVEPIVEITFDRDGPFIRSGPDLSIELEGLTIRAKPSSRVSAAKSRSFKLSTIIQSAGRLAVRRCNFHASAGIESAVRCDGGGLTVEQTRFEGFRHAIEIGMYQQFAAMIRQTMISSGESQSEGNDVWGFNVSKHSSKVAKKSKTNDILQLTLDHCTFRGTGLLELSGFTDRSPLKVRMSGSLIQADTLINWEPGDSASNWSRDSVQWSGEGNRFELRGRSWVLHGGLATSPPPTADSDVNDEVESWARQIARNTLDDRAIVGADESKIGPSSENPSGE